MTLLTVCPHTGPFDTGLMPCTRTSPHPAGIPGGHTYTAAWAPDGTHDDNPQED